MWDWANEKVTNCSMGRMLKGLHYQSQLTMLASVIRHSFPLSCSPMASLLQSCCGWLRPVNPSESSLNQPITDVIAPILLGQHLDEISPSFVILKTPTKWFFSKPCQCNWGFCFLPPNSKTILWHILQVLIVPKCTGIFTFWNIFWINLTSKIKCTASQFLKRWKKSQLSGPLLYYFLGFFCFLVTGLLSPSSTSSLFSSFSS